MPVKKLLRDYFSFGRKDRVGILALITLIILIYSLPLFFPPQLEELKPEETELLARAKDSLVRREERMDNSNPYSNTSFDEDKSPASRPGVLFEFDPNTLPAEGWLKLGLREKTIQTIIRYRGKGGRFRKPEDLSRIWGLPAGFFERVEPYIRISQTETAHVQGFRETTSTRRPESIITMVPVNSADTSAFIALPGVGSKLASRIILFREKLGGFYSTEQLGEVYGLPDSTFQKIKGRLQLDGSVRKFNINTVTRDELKLHPYLKWNLANAIVSYREQHGPFSSPEELKRITMIDEETYKKLIPYLELRP
jgi:competence protein ComEA